MPIGLLIDCGTALVFVLTVLLFRAPARKGRVLTAAIAASAAWVAYVREIADLPAGVKIVVLPEGAFGTHTADISALTGPMRETASARGIDIVLGLARHGERPSRELAMVFSGQGGEPVSYLKHHDMAGALGHDLAEVPLDGSVAGVEICADVGFPSPSRDYALAGSTFLAVPASDENVNGWQHSRTALLRGVENGQPVRTARCWSPTAGAA